MILINKFLFRHSSKKVLTVGLIFGYLFFSTVLNALANSQTHQTKRYPTNIDKFDQTLNWVASESNVQPAAPFAAANTVTNTTTTTVFPVTTTTTTPPATCDILSIKPSSTKIGLGIVPRIRKITVTLNVDLEAAGITPDDLSFENAPKGIFILKGSVKISGSSIEAYILFWGVQPGTYNVNLGPCGAIPLIISRF